MSGGPRVRASALFKLLQSFLAWARLVVEGTSFADLDRRMWPRLARRFSILLSHAGADADGRHPPRLVRAEERRIMMELRRRPNEIDAVWQQRTQRHWGLMEWVEYTCRRFKVHRLLIEAKGPGQSAAQELSNRFGIADFVADAAPVKGDKVARG
jgi:hypothetical protein